MNRTQAKETRDEETEAKGTGKRKKIQRITRKEKE